MISSDIAPLITAVGAAISGITGSIAAVMASWGYIISKRNHEISQRNNVLINDVKVQTDGLTQELVKKAEVIAEAKGFAGGVQSEVDRNGNHKS